MEKSDVAEECCVCMHVTLYRTRCQHPICLQCMKTMQCKFTDMGLRPSRCPMCRRHVEIVFSCVQHDLLFPTWWKKHRHYQWFHFEYHTCIKPDCFFRSQSKQEVIEHIRKDHGRFVYVQPL